MLVSSITMDPAEATQRLKQYRRSVHTDADAEYQAAAAGYEAMAAGTPLIHLSESFRMAGVDGKGLPKLAIARADRHRVHFQWDGIRWGCFDALKGANGWRRSKADSTLRFDIDFGGAGPTREQVQACRASTAMVPMIPPGIRPRAKSALLSHYILWEAEWSPAPPIDPMLLKPVGGELYAVIGQWDLTDLERAVIAGTRGL